MVSRITSYNVCYTKLLRAQRIFDSCSDKDCLEDLEVIFKDGTAKQIIENATFVKCKNVEVVKTYFTIEPVPFNKGFYSIDLTYTFKVVLEAFTCTTVPPQIVCGFAKFCKKVILYGSEGNAKMFRSDEDNDLTAMGCCHQNLPTATAQVVDPICLDCKLVTKYPHHCDCGDCCCQPKDGEDEQTEQNHHHHEFRKKVYITIGMFSIIQLQRPVSLLIPAYDYCIPNKDASTTSDSPCELFDKIKFPCDEFFPPSLEDLDKCEK